MHELTIRKCDNGYIVQTDNGCSVVQGNLNNLYSFLEGIKFDPVEDERKRAKEKLRGPGEWVQEVCNQELAGSYEDADTDKALKAIGY